MLLRLQQYKLNVCYKKGTELFIADTLSRAYLPAKTEDTLEEEFEVHVVLPMSTERLEQLRSETQKDSTLQAMILVIQEGWPQRKSQVIPSIRRYWDFKEELAVHDGIIFKNEKLVIPTSLRAFMMTAVHQPHLGEEASKRRARELLYWPSINKDIERMVKSCEICNSNKRQQQKEPLQPHPVPSRTFQRIGADLFEFEHKEYLITADFYSGWFEIDLLPNQTTRTVVQKLKAHMSRYGIPEVLVTDNGPQFDSKEFKQFVKKWCFQHVTSSPYYPQSNGGIERAVQSAKTLMKKAREAGEDVYMSLLNQRNTPRDEVLGSPAQRLMSRRTRTVLPCTEELLLPQVMETRVVQERLQHYREQQMKHYNRTARRLQPLKSGDVVRMQSKDGFKKKGTIVREAEHPQSYIVESGNREYRRNRRHILKVDEPPETKAMLEEETEEREKNKQREEIEGEQESVQEAQDESYDNEEAYPRITTTRSGRVVKPPDRLNL